MDIAFKFLLDSSNEVIGEYELSRLNLAANLRKEMRAVVEQILDALVEARLARWLRDNRQALCDMTSSFHVGQKSFDFGGDADGEGETEFGPANRFRADAAD